MLFASLITAGCFSLANITLAKSGGRSSTDKSTTQSNTNTNTNMLIQSPSTAQKSKSKNSAQDSSSLSSSSRGAGTGAATLIVQSFDSRGNYLYFPTHYAYLVPGGVSLFDPSGTQISPLAINVYQTPHTANCDVSIPEEPCYADRPGEMSQTVQPNGQYTIQVLEACEGCGHIGSEYYTTPSVLYGVKGDCEKTSDLEVLVYPVQVGEIKYCRLYFNEGLL